MQGDHRAQRTDDFHQSRRQTDFLLGLAQGGEHQVRILRVASTTGEGHLASMGGKPFGPQGQHQLGLFATRDGQEHRRLGETPVGFQ